MTLPEATDVEREAADERARAESRLRLRRGRVATAVVAATLVVVVGVVALLGGFRARTDLRTPVAAGTMITTGPYEVSLASATVQHHRNSDEWEVVVSGTARTTGDTSIDPDTGSSGFVFARDAAGGATQPSKTITIGGGSDSLSSPANLTPGLPPVPWTVSFSFPQQPSGTLLVAVFDQEYTTPYLFSDELGWRPTRSASTMTMPLKTLPEQEY